MKPRQRANSAGSQRSATKASSTRPSVTTTCASALISATLVPGRSCRWWSASTCGVRTRSMRRGSTTMSLAPCAQAPLHPRGEHRMGVGRVGADHQDDVGLVDRLEVLGAGRGAEGRLQAVAGRRVADAGAGVDVVVAERGADHLLDDEDLFVGAARRGDAADRRRGRARPGSRCEPRGGVARSPRPSDTSRHGSVIRSRTIGSSMRSLWVA